MSVRFAALAAASVALGLALTSGTLLGWEYVDAYGTQWFYQHTAAALAERRSPLPALELFHPWGKDVLRSSGGNLLDAVVAAPLAWVLGPIRGYNAFVVLAHGLAVLLTYRFAAAITRDRGAGALAALILATDPWVLHELALGRPTQALLPLMVGFFHALWRVQRRPSPLPVLSAAACLALLGYQYWYYAAFAGIAAGAFALGALATPRRRGERFRALLAVAVLAALAAAPGALPLALAAANGTAPGLIQTDTWSLARTTPLTREGIYVGIVQWQPALGWHGSLSVVDLGTDSFLRILWQPPWAALLATALLLTGLSPIPRAAFGAAMGAAALVAVGPAVWCFGWVVPNAPYIALAKLWPVWQRLWWPDRAYAVLAVLTPIVLAAGFARLPRRSGWRWVIAVAAVLANLVVLRGNDLLPFPTWKPQVEAGYRCLAESREGAVVELPWSWSQRHLVAQSVHGHPIFGGMNERDPSFAPPELAELAAKNAAVADFITPYSRSGAPLRPWGAHELAALERLGYRWILLQLDALAPARNHDDGGLDFERSTAIDRFLALKSRLGTPVYHDARMVIWAPWGHGSPCEAQPPAPDTAPLGRTEMSLDLRLDQALPLTGARRLTFGL